MRSWRQNVPAQVLAVLCLMYFALYVDRTNISIAAPLIKAELHLRNSDLGWIFSAFAYPYALFQLVGGWLGDRFGARRTLAACGILVCVATLATGFAGGFVALVAARLALGFGEGAAFPTATRALASWSPKARWGSAQGITHACARLGNAATPSVIAALVTLGTWRASFVVLGVLSVAWVILWLWIFRDDPSTHPGATPAMLARLSAPAAGGLRPGVPWLRLARRMLPVTAVDFCYGWMLWLFLSWIPLFFAESYHLDFKNSALFSSIVLFAGFAGDTVGGAISDVILRRTGDIVAARRNVIMAGFGAALLFLAPVVLLHDLNVATIGLAGAFFSAELIVGPIWSVPMDIAPRYAGSAAGMMNFGFGVAGMISPVAFGYLTDATHGWQAPLVCSMGLLASGAVLACFMRPDRPFDDRDGVSADVGTAESGLSVGR
jgi:sugar phosphate permease